MLSIIIYGTVKNLTVTFNENTKNFSLSKVYKISIRENFRENLQNYL